MTIALVALVAAAAYAVGKERGRTLERNRCQQVLAQRRAQEETAAQRADREWRQFIDGATAVAHDKPAPRRMTRLERLLADELADIDVAGIAGAYDTPKEK